MLDSVFVQVLYRQFQVNPGGETRFVDYLNQLGVGVWTYFQKGIAPIMLIVKVK